MEDRTVESQVLVTLISDQSQHLSVLRGLGAVVLRQFIPPLYVIKHCSHKSCVDQIFLEVKIPVLGMILPWRNLGLDCVNMLTCAI